MDMALFKCASMRGSYMDTERGYYKWLVCAAGLLVLFCNMGLAASSINIHLPFLIEAGGLTKTEGALIPTFRTGSSLLGMLLAGKILKRLNIRAGITAAVLCAATGFFIYSRTASLRGFCCAAACTGLAYGFGGMIPVSIMIERWFSEHRGVALSICTVGTAISNTVMPPLVVYLVGRLSLQKTYLLEMGAALGIAAFSFIIIRNEPPNSNGKRSVEIGDVGISEAPGLSLKQALCLYTGGLFIGMATYGTVSFMSEVLIEQKLTAQAAGWLLSFHGMTNIIGKLLYGYVNDRVRITKANIIFFSLFASGIVCMCAVRFFGYFAGVVSMLCFSFGLPLATIGISLFVHALTTYESYGSVLRKTQIAYAVGSLLGSPFPGIIADRTGSYAPAFVLFATLLMVAFVLIQGILREKEGRR